MILTNPKMLAIAQNASFIEEQFAARNYNGRLTGPEVNAVC
jgi:hypothetical protein